MTSTDIQDAITSGASVIDIPEGEFVFSKPIGVNRNCRIRGQGPGTRLLLADGPTLFNVDSIATPNSLHVTGQITAGSNAVTFNGSTVPLTPGQWVFLKLGVSADDPHESHDRFWGHIQSISGNVIQFDGVFPETIPVYSSSNLSWTTYPGRTGPYGTIPPDGGNLIARGYGLDHTLYTFTSIVDDVVIENVSVGLAPNVTANPLWMLATRWCRNVRFRDILCESFQGTFINTIESIGVQLSDFTILDSRPLSVSGQPHYPACLVGSWSGRNVVVRDGCMRGPNIWLLGSERGKNYLLDNIILDSSYNSNIQEPAQFWSAGGLRTANHYPGVRIRNLHVLGNVYSNIYENLGDISIDVENARLNSQWHGWIDLQDFCGTLEIGGHRFREVQNRSFVLNIPTAAKVGQTITLNLPDGLYRRAKITFADTSLYSGGYPYGVYYPSSNPVPLAPSMELKNFYQAQTSFPADVDSLVGAPKYLKLVVNAVRPTTCMIDIDLWEPR